MAKEKSDSMNFRIRQRDNRETEKKSFWVPSDLLEAFEIQCVKEGKDRSELVSELIANYVNEKQSRKGAKRLLP